MFYAIPASRVTFKPLVTLLGTQCDKVNTADIIFAAHRLSVDPASTRNRTRQGTWLVLCLNPCCHFLELKGDSEGLPSKRRSCYNVSTSVVFLTF